MRVLQIGLLAGLGAALSSLCASSAMAQDVDPPTPSTALYPRWNNKTTNTELTFLWKPSTDPSGVSYDLEVATTRDFLTPLVSETGLTDTKYALTPGQALASGRRYYWRITAIDGVGNSEVSFVSDFYLWSKPAVEYDLEIALDAAFTDLHARKAALGSTTYTLTVAERVTPNVTYHWRVRAKDAASNTTPSTGTFTFASSAPDVEPPVLPLLLYPGARGTVSNPAVGFEWSDSSDPNGVTYDFEVDDDPDFGSPLQKLGLTDSKVGLLQSEALARGVRYYWRVRVTDSLGNTALSGSSSFDLRDKRLSYTIEVAEDAAFVLTHCRWVAGSSAV